MERPPLGMDELIEHWTVLSDEIELVSAKQQGTRLAFALLLKYFTQHGRFPRGRAEFPDEVVDYVAKQTKTSASSLGLYDWSGRTIERHRSEIRDHLGFRDCSVADADKLTDWLAVNVAHAERQSDRVREELLKQCRQERIEPPSPGRITRIVRSALHNAEQTWFHRIAARLEAETVARVLALVAANNTAVETEESDDDLDGDEGSVLSLIKAMPGNVSLDSMLTEIRKLDAIRAIELPAGLFADVAPKVLGGWRFRAAVESPSHLRRRARNAPEATITLLAALLVEREREVTDALVDLLIATVHRVGARAERKVTEELINAFSGSQARRTSCSPSPTPRWPRRTARCATWSSPRCGAASRRCASWCTSSRPKGRSTGAPCRPR